ncbi:MAG: 16S rRNA (uracil(1498)-N(3))-methyltransferase [Nitrospinales bacterium]|nr:16S rRNA (uracil(1498)-N(3))-methyltransferase [Nitrospinales bacterium]
MHRFFAHKSNFLNNLVVLQGSDVSHIRTVLRLTVGDEIEVLDGEGTLYLVRLSEFKKNLIKCEILSSKKIDTESPLKIHLGQSLVKGNGFDIILRKAVELGAHSISPLLTERTVTKVDSDKKIIRWKKIAEESSKQCGRSSIPKISNSIVKLETFCQQASDSDLKLIFWEMENKKRLRDINPETAPRSVSVLIGPEGGFTQEEVKTARSYGFHSLRLGPRIFRAETAPLVVLSILQAEWGDIR